MTATHSVLRVHLILCAAKVQSHAEMMTHSLTVRLPCVLHVAAIFCCSSIHRLPIKDKILHLNADVLTRWWKASSRKYISQTGTNRKTSTVRKVARETNTGCRTLITDRNDNRQVFCFLLAWNERITFIDSQQEFSFGWEAKQCVTKLLFDWATRRWTALIVRMVQPALLTVVLVLLGLEQNVQNKKVPLFTMALPHCHSCYSQA